MRCARQPPNHFGRRGLGATGREMCRHCDRTPSRSAHARVYNIPSPPWIRADSRGGNSGRLDRAWNSWNAADPLSRDQFPEVLLTFGLDADASAWPLYAFLVRRLRLADQAATGGNKNERSS